MGSVAGRGLDSFDEFRMAPGASIVGRNRDSVRMQISIPSDGDGFYGRQCPSCRQIFRVDGAGYEALPDDADLWCVYCGHHDEQSEFMTEQQVARVNRAATDLGMQMVERALDKALRGFSSPRRTHSRSGFGLRIEVKHRSKPFIPKPLPGINEEALVRIRACASCSLRYAVFGEHRFCPVCGPLPPMVVALDALSADTARLDALAQLPPEAAGSLREQGVFTRLWVDTLENLVGLVEVLGSAVFRGTVADAEQRLRGKGSIFQRLDDTADLFVDAGYPDVRTMIDTARWQRLIEFWATRHVFTHNDGRVDAKFLATVPAARSGIGERLTITEDQCRQAIDDAEALCRALTALAMAG